MVSAASIVAKVTRDRAIAVLAKKYGEIGSGYPSDPVTIRFLTAWIEEHTPPPAYCPEELEDGQRDHCKKIAEPIIRFLRPGTRDTATAGR